MMHAPNPESLAACFCYFSSHVRLYCARTCEVPRHTIGLDAVWRYLRANSILCYVGRYLTEFADSVLVRRESSCPQIARSRNVELPAIQQSWRYRLLSYKWLAMKAELSNTGNAT
jgi:hypothetical protein